MSDFGPRITIKIVESLRDDIYAGRLKTGSEIKVISPPLLFLFYFFKIIISNAYLWHLLFINE